MFIGGSLLAVVHTPAAIIASLFLITIATVVMFVCFNAYVLDFISKTQLSQCETSRMFYSALGWTTGPALGVILLQWWAPAPFLVAACAASAMLGEQDPGFTTPQQHIDALDVFATHLMSR